MAETQNLPEFENPPVSEVVLGVQFEPLLSWAVPHYGLYWARIRDEYPEAQVQPPVVRQVEIFGAARFKTHGTINLSVGPENPRCWFLTADQTRLVQVQNDRFLINWRKVVGDEVYPRYEKAIRPKFAAEFARFMAYLKDAGMESMNVTQCEVTYINDVPLGEGWTSFSDLHDVISPWSGEMTDKFLPPPETIQINVAYPIPEQRGRLHVAMQHAFRPKDSKETIQLRLTARGKPQDSELKSILEWFDMGREWIVRGFADFTAETAQKRWERTR